MPSPIAASVFRNASRLRSGLKGRLGMRAAFGMLFGAFVEATDKLHRAV
jgi:hypothetical protein